ncbi:MAG: AAA family ATPase [Marinosulfonomonas sp.]|nr:AAA family ATPase [Marinosulfonomonas sp.]
MASSAALQPEPAPIVACTVSRDVQNFELLIEDMETELGESWGDLSFEDAKLFFGQPDASNLEFAAIAMDEEDEDMLAVIADLIKLANSNGIKVIVIAAEVSPIALHQLLKLGAEEFVPYPLPDGALHEAIERIRAPEPVLASQNAGPDVGAGGNHNGVVLAVHGLAGGVGATTFAVNMAWELANIDKNDPPRVCILDMDLQNGSVATYLDLPRRESVYEMITDTENIDKEAFMAALVQHEEKLFVLTSPAEMLPLDIITSEDVQRIIDAAKANFDYVVVDMPSTVVQWTEVVLHSAHVYFAPLELDMRSAQNALRLIRALKSEELPFEKLRYVLNRAPKFTDMSGKSRVKRLAESLDIVVEVLMPDGGKPVVDAGDNGIPLASSAAKNPLRKEILKLATSVHELNQSVAEGG